MDGNVVWANQGIYKIERLQAADESQHRTVAYNRSMDRRVEIPEDLVRDMTMKDLDVHQNYSLDSAYLKLLTGDKLVLESLFPRIQQMRGLRRRLSDQLGVTGDEEHGVSPPPAKKRKTSGAGHAPTAAAGAPTPASRPHPQGWWAVRRVALLLSRLRNQPWRRQKTRRRHPKERERKSPMTSERPNLLVVPCRQRPKHTPEARRP